MIFNVVMAVVFAMIAGVYLSLLYRAVRQKAALWRGVTFALSERPGRYWSYLTIFAVTGLVAAFGAVALGHGAFIDFIGQSQ